MNRREEIRKQEEITRVLATFGYQPTFHNLKQVSRRVNAGVFAQNPYQAVRDALLDAQRFKELEEPEPKTRTVAPTEIVESALNRYPRYRGVDSNVAMILTSLEGAFSASSVEQAIARCIQQRKLGTNSEYAEAIQTFFKQNHPEYDGVAANVELLVAAAEEHFGTVTADSLEDAFRDDVIGVREKLCLNPAARKAREDASERQAIIDGLLSAKTAIRVDGIKIITNEANQQETFDHFKLRVEQMDLNQLRQIRDARSQARDYRNMSKEQLREVVREQVAAAHPKPEQFLPLPSQFKVPGKEIYLDWSRRLILSLPAPILRDLTERHGQEAINKILNQ